MPHDGHDHEHAHHHSCGHDHGTQSHGCHSHGAGGHSHVPASFGMAFAIGTLLNAGFVAAQIFYGLAAHSMALLADAVHNLGDVLGLLIAWIAATLATRQPTRNRTYGWGRTTILASLTNTIVLMLGSGAIAVEAIGRFSTPAPVAGYTVIWVAAAGILINGGTALMFMRGRKDDLNIRGAFLHMAGDAGISGGVVLAGLLIDLTGWFWLDPVTSLLIVAMITIGTWGLLRDSVNLALDAVPEGIDLTQVDAALRALPGVTNIHDLHVWGLSTTQAAITAHLVHEGGDSAGIIKAACDAVKSRFGIGHATFQLETAELSDTCALRHGHVI